MKPHRKTPTTSQSPLIHPRLRAELECWPRELKEFQDHHRDNPFCQSTTLYALPSRLRELIARELPNWFSPEEITFEDELLALCERHQAIGVFNGYPVPRTSIARPSRPDLTEEFFRELKRDPFWKSPDLQQRLTTAWKRLGPLVDRLDAYMGWLITDPLFRTELATLRDRWQTVVSHMGKIPLYPVRMAEGRYSRPHRKARDVTEEFIGAFNTFYDRWELLGLWTWDLPMPRGGNLTGVPFPSSMACPATMVTLQFSPILPLPSNYPLTAIVQESQERKLTVHLHGWWDIVQQQQDSSVRFTGYGHLFRLHFYRETVLRSRYTERFAGHVQALDIALGHFLHLGEDSIKKLRLHRIST